MDRFLAEDAAVALRASLRRQADGAVGYGTGAGRVAELPPAAQAEWAASVRQAAEATTATVADTFFPSARAAAAGRGAFADAARRLVDEHCRLVASAVVAARRVTLAGALSEKLAYAIDAIMGVRDARERAAAATSQPNGA